MSITRRILDTASNGLSKLTSLVIVDDEPLTHVEAAALTAEVTARKAARAQQPPGRTPLDNPLAKLATSDPAARAQRDKQARDRAARIHRERDEREAKQKAAADDAFRRMKEQAARGQWSTSTGSASTGPRTTASAGSARAPRANSNEAQVLEWYKTLGVSPGVDGAAIKSAYRQMMRKYHPDMHAGNPQKLKAANEMSMRVTTAYNGLVAHLEKK